MPKNTQIPYVVMRSHNDMPIISDTLKMLYQQTQAFNLIVFDDGSTDGTVEEIKKYTDQIYPVPGKTYVPGRVLNQGMAKTTGEYVVFLNSDCTPQHTTWLENLLQGFKDDRVAAVFGRQIPRPNCWPLYVKDTEDTFGDGEKQKSWRHCFSMAASAIRRSVWANMKFDESLQYSEDIDWTWRARQSGHTIQYVQDAVVMHSHNYTPKQLFKRQFGEGKAEATIFEWSPWQRSFIRYSLLPYAHQVLSDWKYCISQKTPSFVFYAPILRMAHLFGRRAGFQSGIKEKNK